MIFDSHYDSYKGVIAYVRVVEGKVSAEETIRMLATGVDVKPIEVGIFAPTMKPVAGLTARQRQPPGRL